MKYITEHNAFSHCAFSYVLILHNCSLARPFMLRDFHLHYFPTTMHRRIQSFIFVGAISEKILWGGGFFIATPVSRTFGVLCIGLNSFLIHFLIQFMWFVSKKQFLRYEILLFGGLWLHGPVWIRTSHYIYLMSRNVLYLDLS